MDDSLQRAKHHFSLGIEHFESGRLEQARVEFETALQFAPGRPSLLGNLGITLFQLGRRDEALPYLQAATEADPEHVEAWTCLALDCEAKEAWQQAIKIFERLCALRPKQASFAMRKGECHLRLGQMQEALHAFDSALVADLEHADAWSARGSVLRELHKLEEAAHCFRKALACGGDAELNHYYLASVSGPEVIPPPPRAYVETLFDDYAHSFQQHVVQNLRYRGHELLLQPLLEKQLRFRRALDLGCGTGLCGQLLRPVTEVLDGVDISQAMLEQAGRTGIYRQLIHADLPSYLATADEKADLIVAADVFIYVGELASVFQSVRRLLNPGGWFAFTVELPTNGEDLQLQPSLRYAHSETYIRQLANAFGFEVSDRFAAPLREDQGTPIQGMYFYLR